VTEPAPVSDFYERSTRWMLRLGRGSNATGSIHRELWADGVRTTADAVLHANALVAEALPDGAEPRILDLGCGVGGSLCWMLARRPDAAGVGLTISPAQVALAAERAAAGGLADRCAFVHGDFTAPPDLGAFDLAFAIEAFVHSPEPGAFVAAAARLVRPGGRLVLVDDFLTVGARPPEGDRAVAAFVAGWHARSVSTVHRVASIAAEHGFDLDDDRDLTPWVPVGRPRDRWIALLVRALGWAPIRHPYWSSLVGGDALQTCLRRGWISYRRIVFRRRAHDRP
jgi:SAM-dependent methyltransferase